MVHDLSYCSSACAIELGEQVVVTGGSFSHDLVTLYNQQVAPHSRALGTIQHTLDQQVTLQTLVVLQKVASEGS